MLYQLIITDKELSYNDYKEEFNIGFFKSKEEATEIAQYYIKNIEGTKPELTEKFREQAGRYFRDYLNTDVIPQLDISVVNFCMQVSVVDAFNRELAEYIYIIDNL